MKKRILFIGTGGTIASEMTENGLLPAVNASALLGLVPEVETLCDTDCEQLFDLDSTNIGPEHWLAMAGELRRRYDGYDGFVISHGTDTMAYSAAALSYLVQGSPKPIILTGAQKPIGFDTTDSKVNLADSFRVACSDTMHGVAIVFNGRVISGVRASKTHSKSFDAFSSVNYPNLADVRDGRILQYIVPECFAEPVFGERLETRVGLLKLYPGMDADVLRYMLEKNEALVVESFGVGGLPQRGGMQETLLGAASSGKYVVMTTQVPNEGSDLAVYGIGRPLASQPGILEAYDMTSEAALAKIMWILSAGRDRETVRKLFYTPVGRDILRENLTKKSTV